MTLLHDLKAGARSLWRSPGVTAAALLSLALGVGVSSAVFSVVQAQLLTPLPFPQQDELVYANEITAPDGALNAVSGPDLADFRARARSFQQLGGFRATAFTLTGLGEAERIDAGALDAQAFAALRIAPAQGRGFDQADDAAGAPQVVLISERLARRKLAADGAVLGRTLTLDRQPFTIVGVMPGSFRFPLDGPRAELWVQPRYAPFGDKLDLRALFFFQLVGRLAPGASLAQARSELQAIVASLAAAHPDSHANRSALVVPLREQLVGHERSALLLLLSAVGLLLLIACANVGNLLLARAISRRQELAVRAALGATRGQLLGQLLVESALLGLAGGALGVAACAASIDALSLLLPPEVPRFLPIAVDAGVLAFALGASLLCTLLFGSAPALLLAGAQGHEALRASHAGSARGLKLRSLLVVAEVALALALLVSATLLARSLRSAQSVDPGFSPDGLLAVNLTLPESRYPEAAQPRFAEELLARAAAIPGVTGASLASPLPIGGRAIGLTVTPRDRPEPQPPQSSFYALGPRCLGLLGIRLDRGRDFAAEDRSQGPQVVIVNHVLAQRLWPGEDPVGKRIGLGPGDTAQREVVGLAGDARQALDAPSGPVIYAPYAQVSWPFTTLVLQSALPPAALGQALRRTVATLDADLPVENPRPLDELLSGTVARRRFSALVLLLFAAVALQLAVVGIHGTLSYAVAERTRELGIRLALGAERSQVLALVLRQGLTLAAAGVAIGLVLSLAFSRALSGMLYQVSPTDPLTYAAVSALLLLVSGLATLLPAWRATRVDPAVSLRAE